MARILEWFAIPSSSGPFVRILYMTHLSWVTLRGMAHSFTELHKPLHHDKAVIMKEPCITNSLDMNLGKLWEMWETGRPGMLQSMASQRVGYYLATEHNHSNPLIGQNGSHWI